MHRIDNSTAVATMPIRKPQGTDGFFTQGSETAGQLATIVEADILNAIMMEIANVVTRAGIALNKLDDTQLWNAINALVGAATPHGPAGGDLTGFYPNPLFNLNNAHTWAGVQGFAAPPFLNNGVPLQGKDPGGVARSLIWYAIDEYVNTTGANNGFRVLNKAQTAANLAVDDAGNLTVRANIHAAADVSGNTVNTAAYVAAGTFVQAATSVTALNGNVLAQGGKLRASLGSGGDPNAATLLAEFPFVGPGGGAGTGIWTKLPNGFIIQGLGWGAPFQATTTFNFPVAFPNTCFGLALQMGYLIAATSNSTGVGASPINAAQYNVTVASSVSLPPLGGYGIAIGY